MKHRNFGIELLRIVCMLLIVGGHSIVHGNFVDYPISINGAFAIALTQGGRIAVDCFILITGFYSLGVSINVKKNLNMYIQILTYSVMISVAMYFFGGESIIDKDRILRTFFPFSSSTYWFATCYLLLVMIAPVLRLFVEHTEKKTFLTIVIFFTIVWSILPTVRLNAPEYSNFVWFVYLFLLGAYMKKYPLNVFERIRIYHGFGCLILIMIATVTVRFCGDKYLFIKENAVYLFGEMNKVPALICAITLFWGFHNCKLQNNRHIKLIAGCVFGAYLLHDNPYIRNFIWIQLFPNYKNINEVYFIPILLLCIIVVFSCGVVIEYFRKFIMRLLINGFNKQNKKSNLENQP